MKKINYFIILFIIISCSNKSQHNPTFKKNHQEFYFVDLKGDSIKIDNNLKAKVFFMLDPECPLCKSYSKTINKIHTKYKHAIDFYGIFSQKVFLKEKAYSFIQKNQLDMTLIADTNHILVNFLDARVTPECFLTDENLEIIYRGLIDDWIKEIGRKGQSINNKYLENSINSHLNAESIETKHTKAIGCIIQRSK